MLLDDCQTTVALELPRFPQWNPALVHCRAVCSITIVIFLLDTEVSDTWVKVFCSKLLFETSDADQEEHLTAFFCLIVSNILAFTQEIALTGLPFGLASLFIVALEKDASNNSCVQQLA